MNIDGCILDFDAVHAAPLQRKAPEDDWAQARDIGTLPTSIYLLYQEAMFLSFGAAPRYLNDETHVLFSYLGMILRGLKEAFSEAHEARRGFVEEQAKVYDFGKKVKGETWDTDADMRARRHLRHFLFAICNALDTMADLVALMLPNVVPHLEIGEAQFTRIEKWLEKPLPTTGLLVTPAQNVAMRLHAELKSRVKCRGVERGWLPYLRHLRNKAAHLGDATFREFGLHDADLNFYVFIPRQWPFIWEQEIKSAARSGKQQRPYTPALIRELLIHQDIVSYVNGALAKVTVVTDCLVGIMSDCYTQFENFPPNQAAIVELDSNSVRFSFKRFAG